MSYLTTKRFFMGMFFGCLINPLFAAQSMLDIQLLNVPGNVARHELPLHGAALVTYSVKNNYTLPIYSPTPYPIPGVTLQAFPTNDCQQLSVLNPGDSCIIRLLIEADKLPPGGINGNAPRISIRPFSMSMHEASLLVDFTNDFWMHAPEAAQQLVLVLSDKPPETTLVLNYGFYLAIGSPPLSYTVTNDSSFETGTIHTSISSAPPPGTIVDDLCERTKLAPHASCQVTVTASTTTGGSFTISTFADNSSTQSTYVSIT